MAYRNPVYGFLHAYRDAGAANISGYSAFHDDGPREFLVDNRAGSLCTFAAPSASHRFQADRGAAGLEELTQLVIPEGHNLNGRNVRVRTDTVDTMTDDPTAILATTAITSDATISLIMAGGTPTQRKYQYVRLDFTGSGVFTPALGELIMTRRRVTLRGLEPGWVDMLAHNTLEFPKESGAEAALALGPDRRLLEYRYRDVIEDADFDLFDELLAECGTARPFWVWPPWTAAAPVWVRLADNIRQQQDPSVPAATISPRRQIDVSLREHLA